MVEECICKKCPCNYSTKEVYKGNKECNRKDLYIGLLTADEGNERIVPLTDEPVS